MHWVSKVVKATVGATERRADIQQECHIARNNFKIERVFSIFNLAAFRMKEGRTVSKQDA